MTHTLTDAQSLTIADALTHTLTASDRRQRRIGDALIYRNPIRTARSGGRGHMLDDAGSAYAIGRDILSAVIRASDGRGEPTALSEAVFELCGTDDIAAITARYTACPKSEIAALAPLISSHAEDAIAGRIEATAAEELSLMAAAVTKKLELSAPSIALMGGTLLHQPRLCALTAERIRARVKDARCFLCDKSAAVGAGEFALARGG